MAKKPSQLDETVLPEEISMFEEQPVTCPSSQQTTVEMKTRGFREKGYLLKRRSELKLYEDLFSDSNSSFASNEEEGV